MATKKTTTNADVEIIQVQPIKIQKRKITIVGDTPLIVHAWSEKAKKEMLEKQMKTTKTSGKAVRDPFAEFMNACYWITPQPEESTPEAFEKAVKNGAKFGFPVTAIKQCAASAMVRNGVEKNKMGMRGAFFIEGIGENLLGEIITPEPPKCKEDMVKIGGVSKTSDLRYRPMFENWRMELTILYNENSKYKFEQIVNAINQGGFCCGIGEWRPERDGQFGMFHVETN